MLVAEGLEELDEDLVSAKVPTLHPGVAAGIEDDPEHILIDDTFALSVELREGLVDDFLS